MGPQSKRNEAKSQEARKLGARSQLKRKMEAALRERPPYLLQIATCQTLIAGSSNVLAELRNRCTTRFASRRQSNGLLQRYAAGQVHPIRNGERGVVEGCALGPYTFISKRLEESHYSLFVIWAEAGLLQAGINVCGGEVSTAAVEIDHLAERGLSAVDEVRTGELDVAKTRSLDGSADCNRGVEGNKCTRRQTLRSQSGYRE